jgi:hypothetical protein
MNKIENLGELEFSEISDVLSKMLELQAMLKEEIPSETKLEIESTLNALSKALFEMVQDYFKCDDASIKASIKESIKPDEGKCLTINGKKYIYGKSTVSTAGIDRAWLKANGYKSHEDFYKATNTPYIKQDVEYRFNKKYYEDNPSNESFIKVDTKEQIIITEQEIKGGNK